MTFKNVYGLYWVDPSNQSEFNAFEVSGLTFYVILGWDYQ